MAESKKHNAVATNTVKKQSLQQDNNAAIGKDTVNQLHIAQHYVKQPTGHYIADTVDKGRIITNKYAYNEQGQPAAGPSPANVNGGANTVKAAPQHSYAAKPNNNSNTPLVAANSANIAASNTNSVPVATYASAAKPAATASQPASSISLAANKRRS